MTKQDIIRSMLEDFAQQQHIQTAIGIDQKGSEICADSSIDWEYFSLTQALNLPFIKRYDFALIILNQCSENILNDGEITQVIVKMRDLMSQRLLVVASPEQEKLLRALGLTQLLDRNDSTMAINFWQFNILDYKHTPDWLNAKFWANPENWNKFRW